LRGRNDHHPKGLLGFDPTQSARVPAALALKQERALKHALIFAHPRPRSFTASVAGAYAQACETLGHEVITRDLYRSGFDPSLKVQELPFDEAFAPPPDVVAERDLLGDCDVFAFFYPLWLNTPPAMIKGYMDRVFGFGFAYGAGGHSYTPLLTGRKLISFTSSGAPNPWLEQTGHLGALRSLFDDYFASLCGMVVLEHVHAGAVTPGASASFVQARLDEVRKTVDRHFGKNPTAG
jgi:NAD(P)H dehydrogenase (quinone)